MGDDGRGIWTVLWRYFHLETNRFGIQMCDHFKSKNTPAPGALMPADAKEAMQKYQESKAKK